MVSYVRQMLVCDSILKTIRQELARSSDSGVRQKANKLPTTDAILRTVSLVSGIETEERLKDFITEYALGVLNLTETQKEQLSRES
jgi:hypothetical protein